MGKRTPREQIQKELGQFIERKMYEREKYLITTGTIKKPMSRSQLAKMVGVSRVMMNDVINGNKSVSNKLLCKIADTLNINYHEIFRVARRMPPHVFDGHLKNYLGEYYIEGMELN